MTKALRLSYEFWENDTASEMHKYKIASERKLTSLKYKIGDFPGGPVVGNPPSNAGHADSIPGQRTKIPHASGWLSLHTATTEPVCRSEKEARKPQERSHVPQLRPEAAKNK